ncbi:MAG: FmdB family transcriptional regulator [Actinobacteria bacterium]|nr:FmdB family transcriptional regulator [Actinomycetota bacterium]
MPIYEYRCDQCGESFDVLQRMSDDPLVTCEECGGTLRKVLHPVAIHFKGSGFYTTDYGKGSSRRPGGRDAAAGEGESAGEGASSSGGKSSSEGKSPSEGKSSGGEKAPASSDAKPAKDGGRLKEKQKAT